MKTAWVQSMCCWYAIPFNLPTHTSLNYFFAYTDICCSVVRTFLCKLAAFRLYLNNVAQPWCSYTFLVEAICCRREKEKLQIMLLRDDVSQADTWNLLQLFYSCYFSVIFHPFSSPTGSQEKEVIVLSGWKADKFQLTLAFFLIYSICMLLGAGL